MSVKKIAAREKKQAGRRLKRNLTASIILFCLGWFLGGHRDAIKAFFKSGKQP